MEGILRIEGTLLTNAHKGMAVIWLPIIANGDRSHPQADTGTIEDFDEKTVHVLFAGGRCHVNPDRLLWDK